MEIPVLPDDKKTDTEKEMIDGLEVPFVHKDGDHIAIAPETPHQDTRLERFPLAKVFERVRGASSSNNTEGEVNMEQYEELPTEVIMK